jgi:hypothetical protein
VKIRTEHLWNTDRGKLKYSEKISDLESCQSGLESCRQRARSWNVFYYGLPPEGLPCLRGYPGCEECMACARQKHQRIREKLRSKYVSVCSGFGDTISFLRSGAKSWTWCGG